MKKIRSHLAIVAAMALTAVMLTAAPAITDISLKEVPDFVEDISIGGGTELYFMPYQQNALGIDENDYEWVDGVFKLNTTVRLKSNVEFKVGLIYSGTFGEDYFGFEDTEDFDADEAYIKFNKVFNMPVDLTIGRQIITVEKGFLMSEGNLDFTTAVYTNAEKAAPFAVRADIALGPVTLLAYGESIATDDIFANLTGKGEDIEAYGLNADAALAEGKNVYAGVIDWDAELGDAQNDYVTYYAGTDLTFGPIHFEAEYAIQTGDNIAADGTTTDQEATAYFAFLKYTMEDVRLMPWIEVGTYSFSGDDPNSTDNEGFNSMTLGFPDWGKFSPGEVFGEQFYFGGNNYTDYMVQVGFMPKETMQIRLQYHHVLLEEDTGFSDDALYDEYNLFFEFFPNDKLYCGVMLGMAEPDTGHEELMDLLGISSDASETSYAVMPYLIYYF